MPNPPIPDPAAQEPAAHDAELAARLERLAARRDQHAAAPGPPHKNDPTTARASARRRHPARGSRIGALALSIATTGGLTWLLFASNPAGNAVLAAAPRPAASPPATGSTPPTATAGATAGSTAGSSATTVVGPVATNRYGPVQVQATFAANGQLSNVKVLQSPSGGRSTSINNRAIPTLNSEALSAQSAKVHSVSGATYTSQSYSASLQAAIDRARSQALTTLQ